MFAHFLSPEFPFTLLTKAKFYGKWKSLQGNWTSFKKFESWSQQWNKIPGKIEISRLCLFQLKLFRRLISQNM